MSEEEKEKFVQGLNALRALPAEDIVGNFTSMMIHMSVSKIVESPPELFTVGMEILNDLTFDNQLSRRVCADMQLCLKHLGALQSELNSTGGLTDEEMSDAIQLLLRKK